MTRDELIQARKERKTGRVRRRRVLALVGAVLTAAASASGLWWAPPLLAAIDAVVSEPLSTDKAPPEDTAPALPPEVLP